MGNYSSSSVHVHKFKLIVIVHYFKNFLLFSNNNSMYKEWNKSNAQEFIFYVSFPMYFYE